MPPGANRRPCERVPFYVYACVQPIDIGVFACLLPSDRTSAGDMSGRPLWGNYGSLAPMRRTAYNNRVGLATNAFHPAARQGTKKKPTGGPGRRRCSGLIRGLVPEHVTAVISRPRVQCRHDCFSFQLQLGFFPCSHHCCHSPIWSLDTVTSWPCACRSF